MRRLLRRKTLTIIAAIVSFTAIPAAAIVVTATPALADVNICLTNGIGCVGAPSIDYGNPVVLTFSGRDITRHDTFFQYNGDEVFQLQFTNDTTKCLGLPDLSAKVTVRACSGGQNDNTYWARDVESPGNINWINTGGLGFLASDNTVGHQLSICFNGCSGWHYTWDN